MSECDIIKINICRNLSDANLKMYKHNIATFEHGQPKEFLTLMKNFKNAVDGTDTKLAAGKYIIYLLYDAMKHSESLTN